MAKRIRTGNEGPIRTPEGEGVGANRKTTIKLLRPEDVWQPALGAPRGNRNAAKPVSTLKAQVRAFKRRVRKALRAVKA